MDRRLPRDEDGLAPDRGVAVAVGTNRPTRGRPGRHEPGAVERRIFVNASPRVVWAALHDPANAAALFPQLRLDPPTPDWPAAAATRRAQTRLGLLRDAARVESLEARPQSSFALRVIGDGFSGEFRWWFEPVAGGTRVVHLATFEPHDRWAGLLVKLGRESLAGRVESHLLALKERAEAADHRHQPPA
jgi:carbon monoxide dehydrogenase subunit G